MTQLFLIHSEPDHPCAAQLRHDLAAQGYTTWDAPASSDSAAWQQGITDSRAVVLVWSAAAAQDASVTARIDHALWLHQRVLVIATDGTALPARLANAPTVRSAPPCMDAASQLRAHLPVTGSDTLLDDLLTTPPAGDAPPPPEPARAAPAHIFGARCANGHVTYFDKREVCRHQSTVARSTVLREGKELDALRLRCGTPGCGKEIWIDVDCEGYR
jgi:hypothetical protein